MKAKAPKKHPHSAILLLTVALLLSGILTSGVVKQCNLQRLYRQLEHDRKKSGSLVVLFYSPTCGECHHLIKFYKQAARRLHRQGKKIKFMAANAVKEPTMIAAFRIQFFPSLEYFEGGIPRARMPLILAQSAGMTQQWMRMMNKKYSKDYDDDADMGYHHARHISRHRRRHHGHHDFDDSRDYDDFDRDLDDMQVSFAQTRTRVRAPRRVYGRSLTSLAYTGSRSRSRSYSRAKSYAYDDDDDRDDQGDQDDDDDGPYDRD